MRTRLLLPAVAATALAAAPCAAQLRGDSLPVRFGDRVRLSVADGTQPRFPTSLGRVTADTLYVVRGGGEPRVVPVVSLTRLEVSRGGRGRGAVVGGTLGAALLAVPALLVSRRAGLGLTRGNHAAVGLLAAVVGGGAGAWAGAAAGERWEPVLPATR